MTTSIVRQPLAQINSRAYAFRDARSSTPDSGIVRTRLPGRNRRRPPIAHRVSMPAMPVPAPRLSDICRFYLGSSRLPNHATGEAALDTTNLPMRETRSGRVRSSISRSPC